MAVGSRQRGQTPEDAHKLIARSSLFQHPNGAIKTGRNSGPRLRKIRRKSGGEERRRDRHFPNGRPNFVRIIARRPFRIPYTTRLSAFPFPFRKNPVFCPPSSLHHQLRPWLWMPVDLHHQLRPWLWMPVDLLLQQQHEQH